MKEKDLATVCIGCFLHAWLLCFTHPVTGEPMEFETPVPTAFKQLFR